MIQIMSDLGEQPRLSGLALTTGPLRLTVEQARPRDTYINRQELLLEIQISACNFALRWAADRRKLQSQKAKRRRNARGMCRRLAWHGDSSLFIKLLL